MSKEPDISVRRWIKWGDAEPEEPTSTLVLTSPKSKYVDIRVLLPSIQGSRQGRRPPANTAHALRNCGLNVSHTSVSQLDWAFCGESSRTPATDTRPEHGVWKRWVDSWQSNAEAHQFKDEGDLFPYREGDEQLELEKGKMVHPQKKQSMDYEELWASGQVEDLGTGKRICVTLETVDGGDEEKGMVIRVGQWIQGIVKSGDDLLVERWLWDRAGEVDSLGEPVGDSAGSWKRVVRIQKGDAQLNLPCASTMKDGSLSVGDVVDVGETTRTKWKVQELIALSR